MNKGKINKKYLVEWSANQKCGHVHTIEEAIEANIRSLVLGSKQDFIPIGIFNSLEEACDYYNYFWDIIHEDERDDLDEQH